MQMIDIDQPQEEIINAVLDSPYTRIPLWKEDPENIVGVLHAKNVLRALAQTQKTARSMDIPPDEQPVVCARNHRFGRSVDRFPRPQTAFFTGD